VALTGDFFAGSATLVIRLPANHPGIAPVLRISRGVRRRTAVGLVADLGNERGRVREPIVSFPVSLKRLMIFAAVLSLLLTACSANGAAPADGRIPACKVTSAAAEVPKSGSLFGVNLDWGNESLKQFSSRVGITPAVAVSFANLPMSAPDLKNITGAVNQLRAVGGILLLTLEPREGLAAVTPKGTAELVTQLATFNRSGVPVIVRFAHEMNGSWYAWGQQPAAFIRAFRSVSLAVKRGAPGSSMMWAPNYGGGYPFTGGAYAAKPGSADFKKLDTNGDGVLTMADDPYAPYYPGDDVVDWVGMSLYHWGSTYPWGKNEIPEAGKFAAQLTGNYNGLAGDDTAVPDFYQAFGVEHGKPVAIPETAALVIPRGNPAQELSIKRAWWRQVFSSETAARFPQLHMINWFDWNKYEPEVGSRVDWTLTGTTPTSAAFKTDLPAWAIPAKKVSACHASGPESGR
jgi:hypothetical protein